MAIVGSNLVTNSSTAGATSYNTASITPTGNSLQLAWIANTQATASPITATQLIRNENQTDGHTHYTTGSFTPSANNLVLMTVCNSKSTLPDTPTVNGTGNNLTWVQIASQVIGTTQRITLFRAMGAAPTTGTSDIQYGGNSQHHTCYSVCQFANVDISGTNGSGAIVQSASNSGTSITSLTVTLGAFSNTGNATFGCMMNLNKNVTVGSGFTQLATVGSNTPDSLLIETEWRNDNDTTVNWTFANTNAAGIAVEIKNVDQTGGVPTTPTLTGNSLTWVQVASTLAATGTDRRLTLFRAMGASPSTGVITIDFAGISQTGCAWSVTQFSGTDVSGTNGSGAIVQSATNVGTAVTSLTVTLAAFGSANNGCAGGFSKNTTANTTVGTGFTELGETNYATPDTSLQSEWRADNDTSVDTTFASANAEGIAVEIKAPATGISFSTLTFNQDSVDRSTYTPASISPTANRLQLAIITSGLDGGATPNDPVITGNGLTWVKINGESYSTVNLAKITAWRALAASTSAGAPSISFSGQTQGMCAWSFYEVSGTDISGTNGSGAIVQSAVGGSGTNSTSLSITLAAFADPINNVAFGCFGHIANEATTPEVGFTELIDQFMASGWINSHETEYLVGQDTSVSASWTTSTRKGGVAFEIKAAAPPTPAPTISYFTPVYGLKGDTSVVTTGTTFTAATSVTIGGTACAYTIDSATQITITTVPLGASSGTISVTTAAGTATSTDTFIVTAETINLTKTFGDSLSISWSFNLADEILGDGFRIKQAPARTGPFTTQQTLATTARSATQPVTNAVNTQYYEVVFFNAAASQESPVTSIIRVDVVAPPEPGAPTLTSVSAPSQTSITWQHTNVTDEVGYDYQTSPDNLTWTTRGSNPANSTAFTWTGAVASTTYFMRVGSFGLSGTRHYSNVLSTTTPAVVPPEPTAPTLTGFSASNYHTINFTYTNVANENGYEFYISTDNITFILVGSNAANTTTFAWTGALESTLYYGYVSSFGPAGTRYPSSTLFTTTPAAPSPPEPTAPTLLTFTSPTNVSLTWTHTNVSDEIAYNYETSPTGTDTWTLRGTNSPDTTTFTWSGASQTTTYDGRVLSVGPSTSQYASNVLTVATGPPPPDPTPPEPTAPTLNSVSAPTSTSITWNHTNVSDELGYEYETSPDNVTFTVRGTSPPNSTTFTWTAATQGTVYYMRVSSVGNVTTYPSNVMSVMTPATEPTSPTLTSATALSATSIQWIHTDVDNELGYEYTTSDGFVSTIRGTNSPGVTTFTWATATASTTYLCAVAAIGPTTTPSSNIISVTTPPSPFVDPIAPTLLIVTATSSSLTWFYTNVSDEVGYEFEVSLDNVTFTQVGSTVANATEFTWSSANQNTLYYMRVKSYGLSGTRFASNVLSITTGTSPTPGGGGGGASVVAFNPIIRLGTFTIGTAGVPVKIADFVPTLVTGSTLTFCTSSTNGTNDIIYIGARSMTTGAAQAAITLKGSNQSYTFYNQGAGNRIAPSSFSIDSNTAGASVYVSIQIV